LDEYPGDRVLVGEDDNVEYLGNGNDELHLVFNFPLMRTDRITPAHIRDNQADRLKQLNSLKIHGWGCNTLGNHDSPRVINRYGDGIHDDEIARLNITMLLTLPGTPFLYYGEEIGMRDLIIKDPEYLRDTMATWYFTRLVHDLIISKDEAGELAGRMSRDKNRTPMQWENTINAGFSPPNIHTWLPINPDYESGINVAEQENSPASILNFYRQILRLRKTIPGLQTGDYLPLEDDGSGCFSFLRYTLSQKILVILNYSPDKLKFPKSSLYSNSSQILFSHPHIMDIPFAEITVEPFGILIAEIIS
jgi:alpha-glucosidase